MSKAFDEEITAEHLPSVCGASGVHQTPTEPAPYLEEPELAESLLGSIPLSALSADFQPLVDLRSGETAGFEALPRVRSEGFNDAAELFARASFEKTIGELGRLVREIASRECIGTALYVSVHPGELKYGNLVRPDDPIALHDAPVWLQFSQPSFATLGTQIVQELAGRSDVSVVLDDFGAGPATLKQVIELSPAAIKIDSELIAGLDRSRRKRLVVSVIAAMCEELGAVAIAKGVDCQAEMEAVIDCGIQLAQGYLLGEPAPLPAISIWPPK